MRSSGSIWHLTKKRFVFPTELLTSMGMPSDVFKVMLNDGLLKSRDVVTLCGNGMHVVAAGVVFMWCIAKVQTVSLESIPFTTEPVPALPSSQDEMLWELLEEVLED